MSKQVKNLSKTDIAQRLSALFHPPLVLNEVGVGWTWRAESGGIATFDSPPANSLHRHTCHEISLVIGGSGLFRHGAETCELKSGDVFLAEPGVLHEISSWKTRNLLIIYYFFTLKENKSPVRDSSSERVLWDSFAADHHRKGGLPFESVQRLDLLSRQKSGLREAVRRGHLRTLFLELVGTLVPAAAPDHEKSGGHEGFERALDFADLHFARRPKITEWAAAAGTTPRNLHRWFLLRAGKSPQAFINTRRMEYAARRLTMGLRVAEVASELDYPNPEQFSTAFKKHWGIQPLRFRMRYQPGITMRQTLW